MKSQTTSSPKGYVAPKDWKELTDSEKIERMREIVKNLQNQNSRYYSENNRLRVKVANHVHNEKGEAVEMKKIERYDDEGCCNTTCELKSNIEYF